MESKVLPVKEPLINVYQFRAYALAVILNYDETLPWFYSNFIQLKCTSGFIQKNSLDFDFIAGDIFGGIPWFDYIKDTDKTMLKDNINDVCQFVINNIDNGYYLYTVVDEFFIPDRIPYKKHHHMHDIMVYGYDNAKKVFNIAGYNSKMKYAETEAAFDSFYNAFSSSEPVQKNMIVLFKKIDNVCYDFNIERVFEKLEDYVYSKDCSDKLEIYDFDHKTEHIDYIGRALKTGEYVFGMNVYEQLILFCEAMRKQEVQPDFRPFHCLWEHKSCMLGRIKYLIDQNYLKNSDNLYKNYQQIESEALIVRNKIVKMIISGNPHLIENVKCQLNKLSKDEYALLSNLLLMY